MKAITLIKTLDFALYMGAVVAVIYWMPNPWWHQLTTVALIATLSCVSQLRGGLRQ